MVQEGNPTAIFVSYAMADSKRLHITKIIKGLKKRLPQIKIHYWEGWDGYPDGNIIDFMEDNIRASDIFIPICTEDMLNSKNCKKERDMAYFQNKRVIPVFEQFEFVPDIFQPYKGLDILKKRVAWIVDKLSALVSAIMPLPSKPLPKKGKEKEVKKKQDQKTTTPEIEIRETPMPIKSRRRFPEIDKFFPKITKSIESHQRYSTQNHQRYSVPKITKGKEYDDEEEIINDEMVKKITIDLDKCNGDGICVDTCPVNVFKLDEKTGKAKVVNTDECTECLACQENCPEEAITVDEEYDDDFFGLKIDDDEDDYNDDEMS